MFEKQQVGGAAERLRAASLARAQAEIAEATAIAELAAEQEWPEDATFDLVGRRPVRIGAHGTALVDEFLPLEVAGLRGISVGAATWLIRDIVNLKTRHPQLWFQLTRGNIPVFRACQLAAEAARYELTREQAEELDAQLAPKVPILPWPRVLRLARGLIATIAADKVTALAERALADRYVRKQQTASASVAFLSARLDTADAIFFDAAVDRIADILGERGDDGTKRVRRAKAVGILATPARAQLMMAEASAAHGAGAGGVEPPQDGEDVPVASADRPERPPIEAIDPRLLPRATVFVHVAEETLLSGRGTAHVEGAGAVPAAMLRILLGHTRVRLTPVVQPYRTMASDAYEIPESIRRQVLLRDRIEVFPFSSRPARHQDLDHTVPFVPGRSRQTRTDNLGPLSRSAHRGKTHGGWQVDQPEPGVFRWQSPAGVRYRVTPHGTHRLGDDPRQAGFEEALWEPPGGESNSRTETDQPGTGPPDPAEF